MKYKKIIFPIAFVSLAAWAQDTDGPRYLKVEFVTKPAGAMVKVERQQCVSPCEIYIKNDGNEHPVSISKPGYKTEELFHAGGKRMEVELSLDDQQRFEDKKISGTAPFTISFHPTVADVDGQVVSFEWYFGDGQTSVEQNPVHTFMEAGEYRVVCRVTDNDKGIAEDRFDVLVYPKVNRPPVVNIGGKQSTLYVDRAYVGEEDEARMKALREKIQEEMLRESMARELAEQREKEQIVTLYKPASLMKIYYDKRATKQRSPLSLLIREVNNRKSLFAVILLPEGPYNFNSVSEYAIEAGNQKIQLPKDSKGLIKRHKTTPYGRQEWVEKELSLEEFRLLESMIDDPDLHIRIKAHMDEARLKLDDVQKRAVKNVWNFYQSKG